MEYFFLVGVNYSSEAALLDLGGCEVVQNEKMKKKRQQCGTFKIKCNSKCATNREEEAKEKKSEGERSGLRPC